MESSQTIYHFFLLNPKLLLNINPTDFNWRVRLLNTFKVIHLSQIITLTSCHHDWNMAPLFILRRRIISAGYPKCSQNYLEKLVSHEHGLNYRLIYSVSADNINASSMTDTLYHIYHH